jgi:hypothetical protein
MSADLSGQVRKFVSDFWCEPLQGLGLETRLEEDLGMTGDDAWEFLQKFGVRFEIDFTGLEFHKHFGPEGFGCNPLWFCGPRPG